MLGISTTAVSLAINNRPGVSEETRQKVLQLLNDSIQEDMEKKEDEKEDAPPATEKSSSGGAFNGTILMNIHKKHGTVIIDKPFFSDLVEAAQQETMSASYIFSVLNFLPGQNLEQHLNYIKIMNPSGILLVATEASEEDLKAYQSLHIPMVVIDASFDLTDVDSVSLDNTIAIYRAFDYAYQMGHRNIGYLKSSVSISNFEHRFDGFEKGIRDYHLEGCNHPVIELPPEIDGARERLSEILDQNRTESGPELPSVFLCDLDYIALGALQAFSLHGIKVPEDVSLIGFDDVTASSVSTPPLTTIRVNHGDISRIATELLIRKIRNPYRSYFTATQVLSEFVSRGSVKKLN